MSHKNKRRAVLQPIAPVEYPSPAERERRLKKRLELMEKMISVLVSLNEPERSQRVQQFIRDYGLSDVELVLGNFNRSTQVDFLTDESFHYRGYRLAFARFGGSRRFLSKAEHDDLTMEHAKLLAASKFKLPMLKPSPKRERELNDLLLVSWDYWQDLTPPAVPPRPADFRAPTTGEYSMPAQSLLRWGWDLDDRLLAQHAQDPSVKSLALAELLRMSLDPGLLDGWPGETASWAPYHAVYLLGARRAYEVAAGLFPLLDRADDWLSDRLPVAWGQMGHPALPALWAYLDDHAHTPDQRGVVLAGLRQIVAFHPNQQQAVVDGLTRRLRQASKDDMRANAFIVFVLNRLRARGAFETIRAAFDQGKVDPKVMRPEDVNFAD